MSRRPHSRSAIYAREWAVVTAHPLATAAGVRLLVSGGNAVDAAVAAAAAVGVVEPFSSNLLGGESYVLLWKAAEQRLLAVEATGYAPAGASLEHVRAAGGIPFYGPRAVIVPGSFDGWAKLLAEHGSVRLGEALAPAVDLAERGFPVSPRLERRMTGFREVLLRLPTSARVFLKAGAPYRAGELLVQKELARTLRELVAAADAHQDRLAGIQAARDWVYRGPLAEAILHFLAAEGGWFAPEDLARYEARYVDTVATTYRGYEVHAVPPPSQGIALLQALNILADDDLRALGPDSPDAVHLMVEALKLAYADREAYVADPRVVPVPLERLLSKAYARAQRARLSPDRALAWPIAGGPVLPDTTSLAVADAQGNLLVTTTSIGQVGIVAGDTGVVLNNRMRMFHEAPGHPNCVAPGKRVRITLNPAMALREGRPFLAFASPGADVQTQAQLQAFLYLVEFGLELQAAVDAPRWVSTAFPNTSLPHPVGGRLFLEPSFPDAVRQGLRARGHQVEDAEESAISADEGMVVAIQAGPDGGWIAAADPRRETCAFGW
ncbi:MAG: gamma-glutamyltransferase family protein [Deltaproteobacteria bacterium]|nr:gamma-glutamyltransferase family protein [Deltaproteobacteria bacterium]